MIKSNSMQVNQLTSGGRLLHLLVLEGIPVSIINRLFLRADEFSAMKSPFPRILSGCLIVNIFFESSTRTRTAFEISAKRLGADVVNLDQMRMAGDTKQESLPDTVQTVAAMGARAVVIRHGSDGAADIAASMAPAGLSIINGGDGCRAHPTQGLTDAYTLRQHFGQDINQISVAIVGDVLHSRVARSDICILRALGVQDIRLIGPPAMCPQKLTSELGAFVTHDMESGLEDVDAIILLRIQRERFGQNQLETPFYESVRQYYDDYGLTMERLHKMKKECVVLHPGPINRGVEIEDRVADSNRCLVLNQVANGMLVRMAVLTDLLEPSFANTNIIS